MTVNQKLARRSLWGVEVWLMSVPQVSQPREHVTEMTFYLPGQHLLNCTQKKWKNIIFSRCIGTVGLTVNCCLDNSHSILFYYKHITWNQKSILCVVDIFWNHFTVYMFKSVKCLFISLVGWSMIVGRDCSCILSSYGTVVEGTPCCTVRYTVSSTHFCLIPFKNPLLKCEPGNNSSLISYVEIVAPVFCGPF